MDKVKDVVKNLDSNDAESIRTAKELLKDKTLVSDLVFIKTHFEILPVSIKKLEGSGLTLTETFDILDEAYEAIKKIPGKKGKSVQTKLDSVLNKNRGEKVLREVVNIINGEQGNIPKGWTASDVACLKYSPVQSVDVERSFSLYKTVLTERREGLTEENLNRMMVCNLFHNRE